MKVVKKPKTRTKHLAVLRRRKNLLDMMMEGKTHREILVYYIEQYPDLTSHSMEKDITWVYQELNKYINKDVEQIIDNHIVQYDRNIELARDIGQISAANQAMKFKEELLGLRNKPDTQVNVQVNNNVQIPEMSIEQIKELLAKNDIN
jgi:hypothetical protein